MNLYHLPDEGRGFFAEVGYDACQHGAIILRIFSSLGLLENYAQGGTAAKVVVLWPYERLNYLFS